MSNRDLIAIGTSAGGVEALLKLAAKLTPDIPATILVTIHLAAQFRSELDRLLSRAGPLPAHFARDGEKYRRGTIYLAPPDRHLLIEGERLYLGSGSRENNVRPAIDPMLRSAAICCGARAIGVVLTGTLDDGASGLWAVEQCGGVTVVQDPQDAAFDEMPLNALNMVKPDHLVALEDLPKLLDTLAHEPAGKPMPVPDNIAFEVKIARGANGSMDDMDRWGRRSRLACPECHGVMWEIEEGDLLRYRCHVGHSYSADVMSVALDENLRQALAGAVRALEERVTLTSKLQHDAERRQHRLVAANWARRTREAQHELDVIRDAMRRIDALRAEEMREEVEDQRLVPEARPAK
jgi:two-component system, chemotaxis family, protein-glutamate methylesterase/glutaminase